MSKLISLIIIVAFVVLGEWVVANYFLGWKKPVVWWLCLYVLTVLLTYVLDLLVGKVAKA